MPSLLDLQRAFGAALLYGDSAQIEPFVLANGLPPSARVQVYRNNTRETFLSVLRATFPVLERLVGENYFRQMAFDYRERFPSPSGNVHHVGEQLPTYLARRYDGSEYSYFPDVARLEWAYQEVMVAAGHPPLDLQRLQQVAPDDYARLIFKLHPAVRLVASRFPVWSIWTTHQSASDAQEQIDLRQGGQQVLLLRTHDGVELRNIDLADFAFLSAIDSSQTLTQAIEAATATDSTHESDSSVGRSPTIAARFDVGDTLRRYVANGVIVDFDLPDTTDLSRPE